MKMQNLTVLKPSYRRLINSWTIRAVCLLLTSLLISSCQTTKKNINTDARVSSGAWRGTVYIKDKVKNKSYTLKFRAIADHSSRLRLDVISSLVGHVASVSIIKDELQYIVPAEKKYFRGNLSASEMRQVLPFEIDPKILFNIFWDRSLKGKDWACEVKNRNFRECQSRSLATRVRWALKPDYGKLVSLGHKRGLVKFKIKEFVAGLSATQENHFQIKNPGW